MKLSPRTQSYSNRILSVLCFSVTMIGLNSNPLFGAQLNLPKAAVIKQVPLEVPDLDTQVIQEGETAEEVKESIELRPVPKILLPEKYVRFHMWDGSIVGGEVQMDSISVRTEFGLLQIPIREIDRFYPGLNSFPDLNSKIEKLIAGLGDKNFDIREKSHRELAAMGVQIRNEMDRFVDGGSAERKKRIAEIKKEIDEEIDSMEEDDIDPLQRSLIRGDQIETPNFSIVGKIEQSEFILSSKFGELRVMLGDVRMADRSFNKTPESIKKKFEVGSNAFLQKAPVSTRIRVKKGDKISIRADGVVKWTNWSTSSGPNGLTNQGKYQNINSGTLIARVGASGKPIKVGEKANFVAEKPGILYLAIAMQDSYTSNSGYRWVGNYNARVEIKPSESE